MRDEAPFLLEWVAYHRAIGFDRIVVYSNDCVDGTDRLLEALDAAGVLTHFPHSPAATEQVAKVVADDAKSRKLFHDGDWVIWLDADEFLNIHLGDGRVQDLVDRLGDAEGICLSWRLFGDSGQVSAEEGFLSEAFTGCARPGDGWTNVKTLFRQSADVWAYFQHRPIMKRAFWDTGRFLSGAGRRLDETGEFSRLWREGQRRGKIDEQDAGWDWAQINHYAVRTAEHFKTKAARGRIGAPNAGGKPRYDARYFRDLNKNDDRDSSILRWKDATRSGIRELEQLVRRAEMAKIDDDRYRTMHQSHLEDEDQRGYSNRRLAKAIHATLAPSSAIDVGCGVGFLMAELERLAVETHGVEGLWLEEAAVRTSPDRYLKRDLEQPLSLDRRFDVCISIEVAEHLEESRASGFVADLCRLSDAVVFSAAINGQGGQGHKNEQWQSYWAERFAAQGFEAYDPFRPGFLRDAEMLPWFRQNVLLFLKQGHPLSGPLAPDRVSPELCNMILPEYHRKILRRTRQRMKRAIETARLAPQDV